MPKMFLSREGASAKNRVIVSLTAVTLALLLLVVIQAHSRPAEAVDSDKLPDLGMARLRGFQIETTADGRKLLRFTSIVVNVGAGPFEVHGQRTDTSTATMTTTEQLIFNDAGGYRKEPTPSVVMYYGRDGHNHWHVQDLEDFELIRKDNGKLVGTGAKHGFCFFDNFRYGSTQDAFYTRAISCGKQDSDLEVTMGLSRGWGDAYYRTLPDQYIDVTGLTSGRYRLWATADADNWFLESDDSNNFTWVDLQLSTSSVKVVKQGPSAPPVG